MSSQPAIHVENVTKTYGTLKAVDNLSFDVQPGEIFALLGPNGSGKSTTIRMILDILKPDTGSIRVLGGKMTDATKRRIGYLPEERGLYKDLPVIEVMTYLGQLKGMSAHDASTRAKQLLEQLDLGEHVHSKISALSKGMGQKVQFAVTVLHSPELIIIDEVFSGLDPVNRLAIKDLLTDFRNQGGAIIMSTHQMNEVQEMADRLLMISKGRLALYGKIDAIREQYSDHAIIVQGEGDWSALAGVMEVEPSSNGKSTVLHLAEGVTMDDVLVNIAQSKAYRIERFERAVPSLDQVFIQVAGGNHINA